MEGGGGSSKWQWFKVSLAFVLSVFGALFYWSGKRAARKLGEQTGALEEDRKRLREDAETGDDAGVLNEWRRSRGNGGE